ncbi:PKD domain-containing protein [Kitasatospora sp. NPDC050463]|uniref:PKD domain-containing protein n=1 Tax=Kitasatospora sp. NPDC050463 TaxID=3155786 RepID=UPI0033E4DE70
MLLRRALGLAVVSAVTVLGLPAPAAIAAEPLSTLYVDNRPPQCSDTGSGAADRPFCSLAAAVKVAEPGQTVHVARYGGNEGNVEVTRSGTPEKPIVIEGDDPGLREDQSYRSQVGFGSPLFALKGVHDVVIRNFTLHSYKTAFSVADSGNVVIEHNNFLYGGDGGDIHVSGASRNVTVRGNRFESSTGITLDPGVRDTVVATNLFTLADRSPVTATGVTGLAVTNNTVTAPCGPAVAVAGTATGVSVRNNVLTAVPGSWTPDCAPGAEPRGGTQISVAAEAVAGTTVDYNTVHPATGGTAYGWAGAAYPSPAAFTAATGQGAHDLDLNPVFLNSADYELTEADTAAFDDADPDAPGVQPVDLLGQAPVDHPGAPNAGPRGTVRDRGAYERTGLRDAGLTVTGTVHPSIQGPAPFTVKVTATAENEWTTRLRYSFDFGDGTPPVETTEPTATHVYQRTGDFLPVLTVLDELGAQRPTTARPDPVSVRPDAPLTLDFTTAQDQNATAGLIRYSIATQTALSPWEITARSVDWGDGTRNNEWRHDYARPGSYTLTVQVSDAGGRTRSTSHTVDADYPPAIRARLSGERVQLVEGYGGDQLFMMNADYTRGAWTLGNRGLSSQDGTRPPLAEAYTANDQVHVLRVQGGRVLTADRRLVEDDWKGWYDIEVPGAAGPLGAVTAVAAASTGDRLHVVAVADGRLYEAVADYDTGSWSQWGDITGAAGLGSGVQQVAAASVGNTLHLAALGTDGHVYTADGDYDRGSWRSDDITRLFGTPGTVTQLAAASTGSRFHVLAVSGGSVHQITADYAAGRWSSWADLSAVLGHRGDIEQLAAAATGNTLRLYGLGKTWGTVLDAAGDYDAGQWSGWNDTHQGTRLLAAAGI